MLRWLATLAILSHAGVAWLHGQAHKELGVGLNTWQTLFVNVVITAAPLVAMVLVWTRQARWGYLLLALSMAGALLFGIYHHYIAVSTDHVSHLPPGDAQKMFKTTAILLIVTETIALAVGILGWRARRANSYLGGAGKEI